MFATFSGTGCILRLVKCSVGNADLFTHTHTIFLRQHELRLNKVEAQTVSSGNLKGVGSPERVKGVNYRATISRSGQTVRFSGVTSTYNK